MNLEGVSIFSNLRIALKRTIVTQSLNMSYPTIMELSFGYLCSYTVSSEAIVSILQKQAERRMIYQMDKFLIFVISFESLTKSRLKNIYLASLLHILKRWWQHKIKMFRQCQTELWSVKSIKMSPFSLCNLLRIVESVAKPKKLMFNPF